MSSQPTRQPGTLQTLGIVFVSVVAAVVLYTHQLVVPLFLGLIPWIKVWAKSLTPKLGLLLVKNSVFIQLRRFVVQASTHFFVKSHKPWRKFLTQMRLAVVDTAKRLFAGYLGFPLWLRTAIAVTVLIATAGSSFAVFALLIIPQPLLEWLKARVSTVLKRLGITRFFSGLWNLVVPATLRHRWYMYVKWKLGRQQLRAAKRVHETVLKTPPLKRAGVQDAERLTARDTKQPFG